VNPHIDRKYKKIMKDNRRDREREREREREWERKVKKQPNYLEI
jgi:hypothetical protein